ncbi:MAG TPA: DUF4349 domain-containing protein [Syntrophomonadaceae bacterium]|nr:DUF4349 domain-containing protein [Syntrophomonadaceae bacterium]
MWSQGRKKTNGWKIAASLCTMLVLLFSVAGCASTPSSLGGKNSTAQFQSQANAPEQDVAKPSSTPQDVADTAKKLTHQWTFMLQVKDSRKVSTGIIDQAGQLKGYLVESQVSKQEEGFEAHLVVKVPEQQANSMVSYLEGLGEVKQEGKSSQDVSTEYYDTDARTKVLSQEEERLGAFLKNNTGNIQDLLAVEKEIARVRGERESLQARMNVLNNQVDYTVFAISLEETGVASLSPPKGTLGKAGQGFVNSLGQLLRFINGLFIVLVTLIPWLIVFGGLGYVLRRFWWLKRKKKKEQA